MTRAEDTRETKAYCLFTCGAGSLAVGVDAVEAVMEANRLVRLPLCPRPVAALGIYRGGLLPVVKPGDDSETWDATPGGRLPAVLVLRTPHGPLGLLIDRGALRVAEDCRMTGASRPEAGRDGGSPLPAGLVAAGAIERDGRSHAVLDVDRTWSAIRGMIEGGYGANGGNGTSSPGGGGGVEDHPGFFAQGRP